MQACFLPPTGCLHGASQATTTTSTHLRPVQLGPHTLDPGLILAPMASVTNPPFRALCGAHGASLTISEMLHAELYLAGKSAPSFNAEEIRSVQLYGTCARTLSGAARRLVDEGVQHIDLNFGCPAPKVLRRGGGAALPGDVQLFERIVCGVVGAGVPVTVKLRAGYAGRETYIDAGLVAESAGVAGVTLHGRTAEEGYDRGAGRRGWERVRRLVEILDVPVFGNGDVFTGRDAVEMVRQTGCAGVVVGRGCLGRPWLFGDITRALEGRGDVTIPEVRSVLGVMMELVEGIVTYLVGEGMDEGRAVRAVRKWYGWFLWGYGGTEGLVRELVDAGTLGEVWTLVRAFDGGAVVVDQAMVVGERAKLGREG